MITVRRWSILVFILLLVGCSRTPDTPVITGTPPPSTLGPVEVLTTSVPDVKSVARAFLDAWARDDYPAMYDLLTSISKDAITEEEFADHYSGIAIEAALSSVEYEIQSSYISSPEFAQVNYRVILHSVIVGDIERDTMMNLRMEGGQWRVEWNDTLVLPELAGGNYLGMDLEIPARANIYDRNGHALVAQADATAIGIYPDNIDPEQEEALFSWLTRLTGLREDTIRGMYENFPPGGGWYLPLTEVPAEEVAQNFDVLSGFSGLVLQSDKWRYYFEGGIAPHVVGYVSAIQPEEVEEYRRRGYKVDERVGRAGLERWGEPYLAGKRGGSLYVFNAQGLRETRLAEAPVQPSQAIYTTLDRDFQLAAQQAIEGFRGAIVVLERDTGRVLAMVSSPGFDPNAFESRNFNYASQLEEIYNNPNNPLYNRATQGQYPLGSVFKIITMAAGLKSGRYTADSTYQCGYTFDELAGRTLYDWTWEHFQEDGITGPSGLLNLPGGLIRSCNPWFWHIGLDLFNQGLTTAVSDMARGFGLGELTGIEGVEELLGNVPDPQSQTDATNLAIGQGNFLSTPIQVADFIAAAGNGGTLYTPQVVEKIAPPDGDPSFTFEPKIRGELPVSPENLALIQEAMQGVVSSTNPRGTAYHVFLGLNIQVAGKTGTAESGSGLPHAWFAGYTFEGREDRPDIAAVVLVENMGEGSDYAAPIFRRLVEIYFRGSPGRLYPWESTYNVTATPEPDETETPVEQGTPPGDEASNEEGVGETSE